VIVTATAGMVALAIIGALSGGAPGWALAGTIAASLAAIVIGALKRMSILKVLAVAVGTPAALAGTLAIAGCAPRQPDINWPCAATVAAKCVAEMAGCVQPAKETETDHGN